MKLKINYKAELNPYFEKSPEMFMRLVYLLEEHPYSYGQMLRAKGKASYLKTHPDYVPPFKDLYDWINGELRPLADKSYTIATKCHWILNGLTDFPTCSHAGCRKKFTSINVEANVGYPKFCVEHSKCDPSILEKRKATCRKHFGADFPMQSGEVKARQAATNIRNIGYSTPLASPKHRELSRLTKSKLHGDENYNNTEQAKLTFAKHKTDPDFLPGIRRKINATNVRNGHNENWTNRERATKTRLENNDGSYWTEGMILKAKATVRENRKSNPNYDREKREKIERTVSGRFGVKCALQSGKAKRRLSDWISAHGGVTNSFQTEYAKEKSRVTMNENHGADYSLQSPEIKAKYDFKSINDKGNETKRRNGTFNASKPEENAYSMLCERFGEGDVERQYKSDAYPFRCDFYVRSKDLYIECNFHWTHGGHWFEPGSQDDVAKLEKWKSKGAKFYKIAIKVWTERDVRKREAAEASRLNYFVAWKLDDLRIFLETKTIN